MHPPHPNGSQEGVSFLPFSKFGAPSIGVFSPNLKIGVFFFCVFFFLRFQKLVFLDWVFFFEFSKICVFFVGVFLFCSFLYNKLKNAFVLLNMYLGIFSLGAFLGRFQKLVFLFWVLFWVFFLVFGVFFQK